MIKLYWKLQYATTYNFLSVWASGLAILLPRIVKEFSSFFFFQIPFCPSASFWEHGMTQNITLRGEIARPSAFTSILSNVLGDNAGSWMIEVTWKWMSLVNCKKRVFMFLIVICTFLLISGLITKKKLSGNKTMPYFLEYWREEDSSLWTESCWHSRDSVKTSETNINIIFTIIFIIIISSSSSGSGSGIFS